MTTPRAAASKCHCGESFPPPDIQTERRGAIFITHNADDKTHESVDARLDAWLKMRKQSADVRCTWVSRVAAGSLMGGSRRTRSSRRALVEFVNGGVNCTALLVADEDDGKCVEVLHSILNRRDGRGLQHIAGRADDEQVSQTNVEENLMGVHSGSTHNSRSEWYRFISSHTSGATRESLQVTITAKGSWPSVPISSRRSRDLLPS